MDLTEVTVGDWRRSTERRALLRLVGGIAIQVARVAFALLLVLLADRVVVGAVKTDQALVVAGLTLAALAAIALTPSVARALAARVSKISIGPVVLEVFKAAERAAGPATVEDFEGAEGLSGELEGDLETELSVESVLDLRLMIERKLTYLAKHVLDQGGTPTFLTIGSLKYDKLLPERDADLVSRLMALRDEDLAELSPVERAKFLVAADEVARSIRATVLHCLVRKILLEPRGGDRKRLKGWEVSELHRERGRRTDFVVEIKGSKYRVAPVFATNRSSPLLASAKKRLAPGEIGEDDYALRIIVLPHNSRGDKEPESDPAVITTDQLVGVLRGD